MLKGHYEIRNVVLILSITHAHTHTHKFPCLHNYIFRHGFEFIIILCVLTLHCIIIHCVFKYYRGFLKMAVGRRNM
jgi:hypothetical protein